MRPKGYYWVKYDDKWEIAKWYEYMPDKFEWDFFGKPSEDSDFQEIDENRIERKLIFKFGQDFPLYIPRSEFEE